MTNPKIPITAGEKRLCIYCNTFGEFKKKYSEVVPKGILPIDVFQRAASIWRHRRDYAEAISALDDKAKLKRDNEGRFASTRTEQELLVDILNEIRLIRSQIDGLGDFKETLVAVRDIHDIMIRVAAQNREQKAVHP